MYAYVCVCLCVCVCVCVHMYTHRDVIGAIDSTAVSATNIPLVMLLLLVYGSLLTRLQVSFDTVAYLRRQTAWQEERSRACLCMSRPASVSSLVQYLPKET